MSPRSDWSGWSDDKAANAANHWTQLEILGVPRIFMTGLSQTLSNLPSYYPAAEAVSSVWRTVFTMTGMIACTPLVLLGTGKIREFVPQLSKVFRSVKGWG